MKFTRSRVSNINHKSSLSSPPYIWSLPEPPFQQCCFCWSITSQSTSQLLSTKWHLSRSSSAEKVIILSHILIVCSRYVYFLSFAADAFLIENHLLIPGRHLVNDVVYYLNDVTSSPQQVPQMLFGPLYEIRLTPCTRWSWDNPCSSPSPSFCEMKLPKDML